MAAIIAEISMTRKALDMIIRKYTQEDIGGLIRIWNEVVEEGINSCVLE